MRADERAAYREGVVLNKPTRPGHGSFVNVGLYNEVQIDKVLSHGLRVTIKMDLEESNSKSNTRASFRYLADLELALFTKFNKRCN